MREPQAALAGATVLAVDDEPDLCEIVRRVLARDGATVHVAGDVTEAIAALDRMNELDLLVTDLRMPDGNGAELAEEALRRYPRLAVLYISGAPEAHPEVSALGAGSAVIAKPFTGATLRAAAESTLAEVAAFG